MSFEFLAPDEVGPGPGGAPPPQRSPIEWAHLDAGARLGERAGWQVVIDYGSAEPERAACRNAVGIADLRLRDGDAHQLHVVRVGEAGWHSS